MLDRACFQPVAADGVSDSSLSKRLHRIEL